MNENTENLMFGLGHIKDIVDSRDLEWRTVVAPQSVSVPTKYKLSALGAVLDQGQTSQCTAFSIASLKLHDEFKEHKKFYQFDPDWLYSECKKVDGSPNQDGTFLRVALKIIQDRGYIAKAERYKLKNDTGFKIESYVRLTSITQIMEAVYHVGPVLLGIEVDEGWYNPVKGIISEPDKTKSLGGHASCVVGYDTNKRCNDSTGAFLIKNSWGVEWGSKGFAWLPFSHFKVYDTFDSWRTMDTKDLLIEG